MDDIPYLYDDGVLRSPWRKALAVWRVWRNPGDSYELKMAEIGFASSRFGRHFARWQDVADTLRADPRTAPILAARRPFGPIDVGKLSQLPADSLGRAVAEHCRERGINPNLARLGSDTDENWILNDFYQTHDVWHVVTGWNTDPVGEMGIAAFYLAQLRAPRFIALLTFLFLLKAVLFAPRTYDGRVEAMTSGYTMGRRALPLFGLDWDELWTVPLDELRRQLNIIPIEVSATATSADGPRGG